MLHCLLAESKLFCHVLVGVAGDDCSHNFQLTWSEAEVLASCVSGVRRGEILQGLDDTGNAVAPHPVLACHHTTNAFEQNLSGCLLQNHATSAKLERIDELFIVNCSCQHDRMH